MLLCSEDGAHQTGRVVRILLILKAHTRNSGRTGFVVRQKRGIAEQAVAAIRASADSILRSFRRAATMIKSPIHSTLLLFQFANNTRYNEVVTVRDLLRLVEADGWQHVRTTGSHRHYKHPSKPNVVTIPGHPGDDVPNGTLKSIQKAAGLEKKQ